MTQRKPLENRYGGQKSVETAVSFLKVLTDKPVYGL